MFEEMIYTWHSYRARVWCAVTQGAKCWSWRHLWCWKSRGFQTWDGRAAAPWGQEVWQILSQSAAWWLLFILVAKNASVDWKVGCWWPRWNLLHAMYRFLLPCQGASALFCSNLQLSPVPDSPMPSFLCSFTFFFIMLLQVLTCSPQLSQGCFQVWMYFYFTFCERIKTGFF